MHKADRESFEGRREGAAIGLFYLYRITGQLLPIYPVYLLLFKMNGLSLREISKLLAIWCVPGMILEVPSSALADRWNRRNTLVIGRLLKTLCFAVWFCSRDFTGYMLGFLLWGSGSAMCSGTEEAWLYDALKARNRENEYDQVWGTGDYYYRLAVGAASVSGGLLAAVDMRLALLASIAFMGFSTVLATLLPEYNLYRESKGKSGVSLGDYIGTLKDGAAFCIGNRTVSILVLFSVSVLVTAGVLDEYDQLIARNMGLPLALVGLWGLLRYIVEAVGSKAAWRLKNAVCRFGSAKPLPGQFLLAILSGLLLLVSARFPYLPMLVPYGLYYLIMSAGRVIYNDSLQRQIEHQGRATVQSLAAMLETPASVMIYGLFGSAGGAGGLRNSMGAVAIWVVVLSGAFWVLSAFLRRSGTEELV